MKKVLLASRAAESPLTEGGFVFLTDLADGLRRRAIEPALFSCEIDGSNPHTYSRSGWGNRQRLEFVYGLAKHARNFDIVHTAHVPTPFNSTVMRSIAARGRRRGTKFVQTITSLDTSDDAGALCWGDVVVTQTPAALARSLEAGANAKLITPFPNPARVSPNESRRRQTRESLLQAGDELILFPGEFDRLGLDSRLAITLRQLLEARPSALVALACRFDRSGTAEKVIARIPSGLRDRIQNFGTTNHILSLLEAADLVIYPARKGSGKFRPPLVLLEALALDTPVVATQAVEIDHLVFDHLTVSVNETESFVEACIRALDRPRSATNIHHRFEEVVDSYESIYREIIR